MENATISRKSTIALILWLVGAGFIALILSQDDADSNQSPFSWMSKRDNFDLVYEQMNQINPINCHYQPIDRLTLPKNVLTMLPSYSKWYETYWVANRTNLLHIHEMAQSRAFAFSYFTQRLKTASQQAKLPGFQYFYFSTSADVSANPGFINSSACLFDNHVYHGSHWYRDLAFNATFLRFGPKTLRLDDWNDEFNYLRKPTNQTLLTTDQGTLGDYMSSASSTNNRAYRLQPYISKTDYIPDDYKNNANDKFQYNVKIQYVDERTGRLSRSPRSVSFYAPPHPAVTEDNPPVRFTAPYFDCGQSNRWVVSAVAPITGIFEQYQIEKYLALQKPRYIGVIVLDLDLYRIDFNPCPASEGNPAGFLSGTARCKKTTRCEPIPGFGLRRGGYRCTCQPGYRLPFYQNGPFEGVTIEQATDKEYEAGFECLRIGWRMLLPTRLSTSRRRRSLPPHLPQFAALPPPTLNASMTRSSWQETDREDPREANEEAAREEHLEEEVRHTKTSKSGAVDWLLNKPIVRSVKKFVFGDDEVINKRRVNLKLESRYGAPPSYRKREEREKKSAGAERTGRKMEKKKAELRKRENKRRRTIRVFSKPSNLLLESELQQKISHNSANQERKKKQDGEQDKQSKDASGESLSRRRRGDAQSSLNVVPGGGGFRYYGRYTEYDASRHAEMLKLIDRIKTTTAENCNQRRKDLILPGEVGFGADIQFERNARIALRLAHFLSAFYQNNVAGEAYGVVKSDPGINAEQIFGELVANVMGDHRIQSSGVYFAPNKFREFNQTSARRLFGPTAYRTNTLAGADQISAIDLAAAEFNDPAYTDVDWFLTLKERWGSSTYGLKRFTSKPYIRTGINITHQQRYYNFPWYYWAPQYSDGYWTKPYFDCNGLVKEWIVTYSVPFFGAIGNLRSKKLIFLGVVTASMPLLQLEINQCPSSFYSINYFKNTALCDYRTTYCLPLPGRRFSQGSYKCECRQGFEYPFLDQAWFFDGQTMETQHKLELAGKENRFSTLKCRQSSANRVFARFQPITSGFLLLLLSTVLSCHLTSI